jgi:hypothetical protein
MSRYHIPFLVPAAKTGVFFDNATVSAYQASMGSYTFTHRVGEGGANRCLVVGVSIFATGTVSSVTYNGVGLTFVRADSNGVYRSEVWRLVAPATGSNTVEVTLSLSLTSISSAESYTGVDQSSPVDTSNGNNGVGTTASASVTTLTSKDRVFANLAAQATSGAMANTGEAPRSTNAGALGTSAASDEGAIDTAGSVTMGYAGLGALDSWALTLVALKPVQVVAPTVFLKDIIGQGGMVPWARA